MEGSIFVYGRQTHSYQFSARLCSYLCHVTISITPQSSEEAGQIKEGLPLAWMQRNEGYNLVKWEITLKSKDKGGMGL